ncbi:MAG TPA: hypothetical protein VF941_11920 [Clostridia bacterium]
MSLSEVLSGTDGERQSCTNHTTYARCNSEHKAASQTLPPVVYP